MNATFESLTNEEKEIVARLEELIRTTRNEEKTLSITGVFRGFTSFGFIGKMNFEINNIEKEFILLNAPKIASCFFIGQAYDLSYCETDTNEFLIESWQCPPYKFIPKQKSTESDLIAYEISNDDILIRNEKIHKRLQELRNK